jgi:hypothetical protein
MVRRALALTGQFPLRVLVLERAEREGRSHLGIACARDESSEPTSARDPKESGDHAAQLEVGILEELVHPVLALAAWLHQGDPRARHIPPGAHLGRWHQAGPDESMGHELSAPGRLPFVRLCARAVTQPMRVTDAYCDRTSEPVLDGLPVDTRAFHRDHRTVRCDEPVGYSQERRRGCRQLTPCFAHLPVGIDAAQTRGARVLVDVDTTTNGRFHLPGYTLLRCVSPTRARDRGAPATRGLCLRVIDTLDWWGCRTPDRPIE